MEKRPALREKGRYHLKYRGTQCLNCGHPLDISDRYCPNCSQINSTKKVAIKDFVDEFFSSLISYDSRLLRTLSGLLIRPGTITKNYVQGKRISYTNPFRFLLSLAIVYFLMVNFGGNYGSLDQYGFENDQKMVEKVEDFSLEIYDVDLDAEVEQRLDSIEGSNEIKRILAQKKKKDSTMISNPEEYLKTLEAASFEERFPSKQEFFYRTIQEDTIRFLEDAVKKYGMKESFENRLAFNSANGLVNLQRRPGSFLSAFISKLPFAIFFFLPVFALFVWLAYIRKKYTYTDHLVFCFHNTSLLFILLIVSYLIDAIFKVSSNWIFIALFSVYLWQAMLKFYGQGIFKTIVKYLFLNTIFFILATLGILVVLAGNLFTY